MGLEYRAGRVYYYQSRRVDGRVRREYVAAGYPATLTARWEQLKRDQRRLAAWEAAEDLREADDILDAGAEFDRLADRVFRAVMHLTGHALHKRSEWRRTRGVTPMATIQDTGAPPQVRNPDRAKPATAGANVQAVIDRAAQGDAPALVAIKELLKQPHVLDALGYTAATARAALVGMAAHTIPTVAAEVLNHCEAQVAKLLADGGPPPTFAEWLAAVRVAHNWLTVHILESLAAAHAPRSVQAAALDRRVTQAEKRLHAALKSLGLLHRLRRPVAVTQVNIAAGGAAVVNNGAPGGTP